MLFVPTVISPNSGCSLLAQTSDISTAFRVKLLGEGGGRDRKSSQVLRVFLFLLFSAWEVTVVFYYSFFQDGLKTADKLKQYIEKLAADLYNVSSLRRTSI